MPSSPEPEAAAAAAAQSAQSAQLAQPWDPAELGSTLLPAPRLSLHESGPDERNQPTPVVLFEIAAGPSIHADALAGARAAAEAAGYAAGWAAGAIAARQASEVELSSIRAAAAAEMDARTAQVNAILGRVRDAASAFERRAVPATEDIENLVVSTAFSVAESIVGASLRDDETRGITALARALALSPVGAPAIISLNPQDHALLGAKATELAMGHDVQIVSDPSLKPGDATVSSGATTIDARISAGLARVQEVLAR